jgi:hypothetical protein
MANYKDELVSLVQFGDLTFVFFPGESGGRLVPAKEIKSVVPDYRDGGSLIFLSNSEKAIRIPQTPEEIVEDVESSSAHPTEA